MPLPFVLVSKTGTPHRGQNMKTVCSHLTAVALSLSSPVFAASLSDDFESDTSTNYTGSDSFGSGGSFTIDDGDSNALRILTGGNNTYSVVHTTSSLEIGESYSIDFLDARTGESGGSGNGAFLMLTTDTGQPNGSSSSGFRLRLDSQANIRLSTLSVNGPDPTITSSTSPSVAPDTFWIDRTTATDFEFYYGSAGSRTWITTGSLHPDDVDTETVHVGFQAFGGATGFSFDNLEIQPTSMDTEPGITSFTASSERLSAPGPVTFMWSITNAISATLNGEDVTGLTEKIINVTESGDYMLEITGADASTVSETISVSVCLVPVLTMDDFETNTAACYTGSDSFGSGGSFTVSGGTLNLTAGSGNTHSIVLPGSSLEIGESFSIDALDGAGGSGNSGGGDAMFLMLTTSTEQPNGSLSFGFRLRVESNRSVIRLATYSNGGVTIVDTTISPSVAPSTFWIDRVSATDFDFYYGTAGSRSLIAMGSLLASEVTDPLQVGVQAFSNAGTDEWNFDHLTIQTTPAPDPFNLRITRNASTPGTYDFTWDSQDGKFYDLISSIDLAIPRNTWTVWDGYADLPASTGTTTTLTGVPSSNPRRYFAMKKVAIAPWTLAGIGDTQVLVKTSEGQQVFSNNTQWLADNAAELHLAFVTQLGDIVENGKYGRTSVPPSSTNNVDEWNGADVALSILDGIVGWGTLIGNHEYDWVDVLPGVTPSGAWLTPTPPSGFEAWKERFGPVTTGRYAAMPEFGGVATNDVDTYFTYTASGRAYLHLHLQADIPDDTIAWAQGIIDAHPGMPTILSTHVFEGTSFGPPNNPYIAGSGRNSANAIWDKLIKDNSQIFMVLSGHTGQQQHQTRTNTAGEPVFTIVQDYAGSDVGGSPAGYLRLYEFDEAHSRIRVTTYSPTLDTFLTGATHQFDLPLDFDARLGSSLP